MLHFCFQYVICKSHNQALLEWAVVLPTFFLNKPIGFIVEKIREIVRTVVDSSGLMLDNIEYIPQGKRWILRIYIDKEGGVSLDDCQKVSVQVGSLLDAENTIPHAYLLEVSSPGLDRPLRRPDDYVKYTGRVIRLSTARSYNNKTTFTGRILSADTERIRIETTKDGILDILFSDIIKAKLEIEF